MKKIKLVTIILLCIVTNSFAQYKEEMAKALEILNKANKKEDFIAAANKFVQLSQIESQEWLTFYYACYSYTVLTYFINDNDDLRDLYLDKAQDNYEVANKLMPNNDEVELLKGYILESRFIVSPMSRLSTGSEAVSTFKKVLKMNPNNPRAYTLYGIHIFHTPAFLGGGAKEALKVFKLGAERYKSFVPKDVLYPNWGLEDNDYWMAKCNKSKEKK